MINNTAIDWKKNAMDEWHEEWKNEGIQQVALKMLKRGVSPELIGELTDLPLAEIEKLEAKVV